MTYRPAADADAAAIAALHTLSWQRTYRGDFPDDYLDHQAPAERLAVWTARFNDADTLMQVTVAETNEGIAGFCCVFPDHSPADGHLLDNLHVHPAHHGRGIGKRLMQRIIQLGKHLPDHLRLVYLPEYDMDLARLMVAGVDVWLNTPRPPMEASGTSGMKAALNGVPSLSVLDGWWLEGCIEGVTGWAVGPEHRGIESERESDDREDAQSLYRKLESAVVPLFYGDPTGLLEVRRHSIALNGSFFNTHRMLQQYVVRAYL